MSNSMRRCKLIVAGDPAVGKTAITQMLISNGTKFPKSYNLTYGVELGLKIWNKSGENSTPVELLIYDSSGYDIYSDMLLKVWKEANLLLLVYDVTSEKSIQNVAVWSQLVKLAVPPKIPTVLFGNKTDLFCRRVVSEHQGEEVAQRLNITAHILGSAKDFDGIEEAFTTLVQQI